ncbi:CASP8-associated protein 2 [Puntigrus tetrazona]|uniref:CASP8-associated protein 2 n=1 Tax=Puntigrus tetrazona TaxID=1606681 RepID=UPI001C8A4CA8|nr:CASP8-associated protein 2 [Puntigrus tetrazona]
MDLIDEIYGDLDDKPFGTLHHNEDSVDIYSGLENSPKIDGHRGKVNTLLSPSTMESMDIYEDIIREEQEEKEATYNELKQKFDEAQKQVKELISKLHLLQTKNSSLNSENVLLKRNICSLIKTARMEIVRKDEEISRLSNRSGRGSYGQNFRRPQMESGPANTRHSLNNSTSSVLESQAARQDNIMRDVNQHKGRNSVSDPCAYPPTTSTTAPQPFEVLQRCPRTDLDSPQQCQTKSAAKCKTKTFTVQPQQHSEPVHPSRTSTVADISNCPKISDSALGVSDTTSDSQFNTLKDNNNSSYKQADKLEKTQKRTTRDKECNLQDKNVSQKAQIRVDSKSGRTEKELVKDNSVSRENRNQQPEVLKSSEQSKSPSLMSHKALPSVSSQSSKNSVKTAASVETQSQGPMHHQNPDRTSREAKHSGLSSTTCTVVDEASHSQNHKGKKRDASGHERKEEKNCSAERRSSRTERTRDYELKRPKESDRSKRDEGNNSSSSSSSSNNSSIKERRSNRSDSSKEYERRNIRETDNKSEDKRSKKQVDDCGRDFASSKWESQRKDAYKEKSSSRNHESLLKDKRSHSHDKARKMEGLKYSDKSCFGDKGKDKDRERKRGEHLDHRVHKHRESKNALTKDDRRKSPKKHNVVGKGQDSKNKQDKNLESESSSVVVVSSSPCKTTEDNSPDRKLSFMETLNLTLSPLKKQKQSSDLKEASGAPSEDASPHNSRLSDAGEEFFVIDELKNSVEEVDEDPVPTTAGKKEDLTSSYKESGQVVDLPAAVVSDKPSGEQTDMDVQENATESQEDVNKVPAIVKCSEEKKNKILDSSILDTDSLSELTLTRESPNRVCHNITQDFTGIIDNSVISNTLLTEKSEVVVSHNIPDSIVEGHQQQDPIIAVSEDTSLMKIQWSPQTKSQDLPPVSNGICQDDVSSSDKAQSIPEINSSKISDSSVNMEVSSSTVSADFDEPRKVICDFEQVDTSKLDCKVAGEATDNSKMTETSHSSENVKMLEKSHQSPSSRENNVASNDSTIVREETMSSSQPGFSEPDSTEKEEQTSPSSNPVVFCPDEDSLMLTLRNIRVIPEPLSPLTSPVRQVKKVQPQHADKQPHVKSLNKDLSTVTTGCNKDKVSMDMNKENKSPDSSVTASSYKGTKETLLSSGTEDDELEDGEIVSESEEEGPLFIQTPPREKDKSTSGTDSSPKLSAVGKRVSQKKSCIPAKFSERSKGSKSSSNDSPTSSKRRFKTVSPPLKSAVYTIDTFMDMLGSIRAELRKKYMKLQKNVTKTAFCCIVDMSQASFIEFINAVDLDKLCCHGNDIKVRLNKIISSIMSKVTKNGIVNRIFEQRAGDLKQKLWTFVDGQFDFLFKEVKTALKSGSEPSKNASLDNKNVTLKRKEIESEVVEKDIFNTSGHLHRTKMFKDDTGSFVRETPPNILPRRGLGSRGKNIKAVMNEDDQSAKVGSATLHQLPPPSSERSVHEGTSGSETRISSYVRRLSHNGSIQDKSDFDILTEQQTTSLTFNLVSDSQMGEIFKCLLQGSDLLESSVPIGDNTSWPLNTPRKEGLAAESLIGIMTPNKTTPSKFLTSWPSISPYKFASSSKMLVDPAILDESCLLEVPSNSEPCQLPLHSTVITQKSYSILAEDLAVSLTIPSPLKSDSHLSFLHPGTGQPLSAPNSVLSAHYSEDALLDGEDATEQDIHLSLDTDNSSCGSSPSRTWEGSEPPCFQFKPNLQMQAVVMERSNDHFIVRIRRTSSGPIESNPNEGRAAPELAECPELTLKPNLAPAHQDLGSGLEETSNKIQTKVNEACHISDKAIEAQPSSQKVSPECVCDDNLILNNAEPDSKACVIEESSTTETEPTEVVSGKVKNSIQSSSAPESECERVSRKRKKHRSAIKAKRQKVEKSQDIHSKSRHKKKSKSSKEKDPKIAVPQLSPSSLSAKNVIRKKGEVVVTWTRDEDRDILIELKMKGPSPKTFAGLSKRLKKSTEQIEERFSQLMKLFKKKEKMEN